MKNIEDQIYSLKTDLTQFFDVADLENFGRSCFCDSEAIGYCSATLSFFYVYSAMRKISRNIGFIKGSNARRHQN